MKRMSVLWQEPLGGPFSTARESLRCLHMERSRGYRGSADTITGGDGVSYFCMKCAAPRGHAARVLQV